MKTPRTDAALRKCTREKLDLHVLAGEMAILETELAHLHDDLERFTGGGLLDCHAICDQRDAAIAERDRLRAEVERLEAQLYKGCDDERDMAISEGPWHGVCGLAEELTARAKKAEADTARLDWLQSSINLHVNSIALRGDIRDAIDKAMKEASK
jgi:hypothetical protein